MFRSPYLATKSASEEFAESTHEEFEVSSDYFPRLKSIVDEQVPATSETVGVAIKGDFHSLVVDTRKLSRDLSKITGDCVTIELPEFPIEMDSSAQAGAALAVVDKARQNLMEKCLERCFIPCREFTSIMKTPHGQMIVEERRSTLPRMTPKFIRKKAKRLKAMGLKTTVITGTDKDGDRAAWLITKNGDKHYFVEGWCPGNTLVDVLRYFSVGQIYTTATAFLFTSVTLADLMGADPFYGGTSMGVWLAISIALGIFTIETNVAFIRCRVNIRL